MSFSQQEVRTNGTRAAQGILLLREATRIRNLWIFKSLLQTAELGNNNILQFVY